MEDDYRGQRGEEIIDVNVELDESEESEEGAAPEDNEDEDQEEIKQ